MDQILPQECFARLEVIRKPILPDVGGECRNPIVEASENVKVNLIKVLAHLNHEFALSEWLALLRIDLLLQVFSQIMHVRLFDLHR